MAIEKNRFEFIKESSEEGRYHFSAQAKELVGGNYKPTSDLQSAFKSSPPAPPVRQQQFAASTGPRFNCKDYMKNLTERL